MKNLPELIFVAAWLIILYSYVLFPLILCALAFLLPFRHKPVEQDDALLPTVTMIVAAYNEEAVLPAKIQNIRDMDYPTGKIEILIGSDGSSDRTAEILCTIDDPWIRPVLFPMRRGKISVLNDLVDLAKGDILCMSDANTAYAPDAIRQMVKHYSNPSIGCVSGQLTLEQQGGVSGEGIYWKYECWIKKQCSRLGFLIGCNGGIFSLRRELFTPLPTSTIVEDFVLTLRVLEQGKRIILETDAGATEPPAPSARAEMIRKIRIGAGNWQALTLTSRLLLPSFGAISLAYWGQKIIRWAAPVLMIFAMTANLFLLNQPIFAIFFGLQGGGILLSLIAANPRAGHHLPKLLRPITYFYVMNYALLAGLLRFLFKTQKVTWEREPSIEQSEADIASPPLTENPR